MIQATWLYYVLFGKTNLFLVLHLHLSHWLFIRMPLFIRIHSFIRAIPLAVWWMIGFAVCDIWMQKSVRCKMIRLPVMVNRGGEFIRAFGFSSKPKYNFRVNFTYIFFSMTPTTTTKFKLFEPKNPFCGLRRNGNEFDSTQKRKKSNNLNIPISKHSSRYLWSCQMYSSWVARSFAPKLNWISGF